MQYISTRGFTKKNLSFLEVVQMGLSPDGGLFIPQKIPKIDLEEIEILQDLSYEERIFSILQKFELEITSTDLHKMIYQAYSSFNHKKICPLSKISENRFLFELFHGPTASFKDMALQLTPHFFSASQQNSDQKFCLLTATSGDTGIAAIEGFRKLKNISVFVIYPEKGVSSLQKRQMQSVNAENVKVLGIDANFDFCQSATKKLFTDPVFLEKMQTQYHTQFAAGNSMNWGRLMPQIAYYFSAYADLLEKKEIILGEEIEVCVPSGNFGNILGAFIAKKMGLPISKFICASNENNILTEFLNTGIYDISNKELVKTDSPSIDILKSSNIERLLYWLSGNDEIKIKKLFTDLEHIGRFEIDSSLLKEIKKIISAESCTQTQMRKTISQYYKEKNILLDPHTAIAVSVSDNIPSQKKRIIAATAHYEKFAPAVLRIFNDDISEKSLHDLSQMLQKMNPTTKPHPNLEKVMNSHAVQTEYIAKDYNLLLQNVEEFLSEQ